MCAFVCVCVGGGVCVRVCMCERVCVRNYVLMCLRMFVRACVGVVSCEQVVFSSCAHSNAEVGGGREG